ncbi:MAG TPA: bifunctional nuclease family protein [Acidimicrobiia bacterium]|nr:bifunctional nuclease family protein [Acidimicrobiia bacterium]
MIRVDLVGVRVEQATNQPIVLLREQSPGRRHLPIFIGQPEATAIVYALQGIETPRPMTHDLVTNTWSELGIRLQQVNVTELRDGTFYAELELNQHGEVYRISSRPSDAIALAVRQGEPVPIFADEGVLEEAGVLLDSEDGEDEEGQIEQFREFLDQVRPEDFAT